MAEKVIKGTDLIEDDVFKNAKDSALVFIPVLKEMSDVLAKFLLQTKQDTKLNGLDSNEKLQALTKALNESRAAANAKIKVDNDLIKAQAALDAVYNSESKSVTDNALKLAQLTKQKQDATKAAREQLKAEGEVDNIYKQKSKTLNDLRNKYKDLAAQNLQNTKAAKDLLAQITPLDAELKKIDETVGQHQRNVGGYKEALQSLPGPLARFGQGLSEIKDKAIAIISTPLGAAFGGIGIAVSAAGFVLKEFYENGQKGADAMERQMAGISAGWDIFKSGIVNTGEKLENTTHSAYKATNAILAFIKTGFGMGSENIGGDKDEAKSYFDVKDSMDKASETAQKLIDMKHKLRDENLAQIVPQSEATKKIKEAREAMFDESKTLKERIEVGKKAVEGEEQEYYRRDKIARETAEQIKAMNELKKEAGLSLSTEELTAQEEAFANINHLKSESVSSLIRLERSINGLEKQWAKEKEDAEKKEIERLEKINKLHEEYRNALQKATTANITDEYDRKVQTVKDDLALQKKANIEKYKDINDANQLNKQLEIKADDELFKIAQDKIIADDNWNAKHDAQIAKEREENNKIQQAKATAAEKRTKEQVALLQKQAEKEFADAEKEKATRLEKEKKERIEREKTIYDQSKELAKNYYDYREKQIDRDISNAQRRESEMKQLAQNGVDNAAQSIALEQKLQAEAEEKKAKLEQQKMKTEYELLALKDITANIEADPDHNVLRALGKTVIDMGAVAAVINSLPTFFDGTENTGSGGDADNKGGFHAILHPNERVINAADNSMIDPSLSNSEAAKVLKMYSAGVMPIMPSYHVNVTQDLGSKLDKIEAAVKNIDIPHQQVYFDPVAEALVNRIETRGKIIRNHYRANKGIWSN